MGAAEIEEAGSRDREWGEEVSYFENFCKPRARSTVD